MKRAALASVMVLTLLATSVAEAAMEGPDSLRHRVNSDS